MDSLDFSITNGGVRHLARVAALAFGAIGALIEGVAIWLAARMRGVRRATLTLSLVAGVVVALGSLATSAMLPISYLPTVVEILLILGLVMLFFGVDLGEAFVIALIAWIGSLIFRFFFAFLLTIAVVTARIFIL